MMAYGSSGCYDLFPPETSEARRSWAESLLLGFDITGCCGLEFFRVLASKRDLERVTIWSPFEADLMGS